MYAYRNRDSVKQWRPARDKVQKLKLLLKIRTRLVKAKSNLNRPLHELSFLSKDQQKTLETGHQTTIIALDLDIKNITEAKKFSCFAGVAPFEQLNEHYDFQPEHTI